MNIVEQYVDKKLIDTKAHDAATSPKNDLSEPTEKQKSYGNYKKGHFSIHGLRIAIENPKGSERKGVDPDGNPWCTKLKCHYGYIKGHTGSDGDSVDVFLGNNLNSDKVFVVNQKKDDGKFDEHKVLLGFDSYNKAVDGYLQNYQNDWENKGLLGSIHMTNINNFKNWLRDGNIKKPFSEV